jgi:hypothetical protein
VNTNKKSLFMSLAELLFMLLATTSVCWLLGLLAAAADRQQHRQHHVVKHTHALRTNAVVKTPKLLLMVAAAAACPEVAGTSKVRSAPPCQAHPCPGGGDKSGGGSSTASGCQLFADTMVLASTNSNRGTILATAADRQQERTGSSKSSSSV